MPRYPDLEDYESAVNIIGYNYYLTKQKDTLKSAHDIGEQFHYLNVSCPF